MLSLGFWNLIIISIVTLSLRQYLKSDRGKLSLQNSEFLQHSFPQKILKALQNPVIKLILQVCLIVIITRWLIYTGWIAYRLTQPEAAFWDFTQFHVAGNFAVQRNNIYIQERFVYFPNIFPFVYFLGFFTIERASAIWVFIHLIVIIFILWGVNILLASNLKLMRIGCTVLSALIYGIVFDLRVGNISSIIVVLLIWAIIFAKEDKNILAGILLALSTIKPTIPFLFFIYFLIKRRWKIIFWGGLLSCIFLTMGLWIIKTPPLEAFHLYRENYAWFYERSHDPFISHNRIDLSVVIPRLLPNYRKLASFLSLLLYLFTATAIGKFLYDKQVKTYWSRNLYLSELTLIGCSSILFTYNQRHATAILVIAVVFLLNYITWEIRYRQFSWKSVTLWSIGMMLLLLQTSPLYFWLREPLDSPWKLGRVSYITKVTVGNLPNYTLIALTFILLLLARNLMLNYSPDIDRLE